MRLYPAPARVALKGLYLAHDLRSRGSAERPFVYSNFVASLDGRISQPDPRTHRRGPPPAIQHANDWNLYLELAAQADAVVTSGARLNELLGTEGNTLQCVRETAQGELGEWRRAKGLPPHPCCIVLSNTLSLPWRQLAQRTHGEMILLSATRPTDDEARQIRDAGVERVQVAGTGVRGEDVREAARRRGFRTLYSIGGPRILYAFAAARLLDRLYLSVALRLLAGETFDTILRGDWLPTPTTLALRELYLDAAADGKPSYLFTVLDAA